MVEYVVDCLVCGDVICGVCVVCLCEYLEMLLCE